MCCAKLCLREGVLCVSAMARLSERNVVQTQMAPSGHHNALYDIYCIPNYFLQHYCRISKNKLIIGSLVLRGGPHVMKLICVKKRLYTYIFFDKVQLLS